MNISRPGSASSSQAIQPTDHQSQVDSSQPLKLTSVDQARSYIARNLDFPDRLLAHCWLEGIKNQAEKGEIDPGSAELLEQAFETHVQSLPLPESIKDKASAQVWLQEHIKTDDEHANLSLAFKDSGCDLVTIRLLAEAMYQRAHSAPAESALQRLMNLQPADIEQMQNNIAAQFRQLEREEDPLQRAISSAGHYAHAIGRYADSALRSMGPPGRAVSAGLNDIGNRVANHLATVAAVNAHAGLRPDYDVINAAMRNLNQPPDNHDQ